MRKLANDPLRLKRGTIQLHYRAVTKDGLSIEATTRTFRCSAEQLKRVEELITELYDSTPEIPRSPEESKD